MIGRELIADDEDDPLGEEQPVEPGVVKAHHVGNQWPDIGVNTVIRRADRDDKDHADDDSAVLEEGELFSKGTFDLGRVAGHQPDQGQEDENRQNGDHPETVMPGKGG